MVPRITPSTAFSMPGGETSNAAGARPIDLDHLSRQTLGDRDVEREVLMLFVHQALSVRERIAEATATERLQLAHGLKGAAQGVGAFAIAACATEIEQHPDDNRVIKRLARLIEDVRDFIAAISR